MTYIDLKKSFHNKAMLKTPMLLEENYLC